MLGFVYACSACARDSGQDAALPGQLVRRGREGPPVMTDWESRYMSLNISEAPPSGMGTDGISDFQFPLDEDRNYTIVVSRPEDRPANATDENGVAWMDWGTRGEGIDDELNRTDYRMLCFRFMHNNPKWAHNPENIVEPGTEV